ncbi:unnamed protein product [Heterobilharzia americana]|nr:unnamed protein product [Heterobilharzia americana]
MISNEKIEESLPYIPQHMPRPTPIEWRCPGEYLFFSLPHNTLTKGLYSIVLWLTDLIQKQCKSIDASKRNSFIAQDQFMQRLQCCFVYMDLWEKGYYISTSTAKMGGDLLVYQGDPFLYHGSHIVTLCHPTDTFPNPQLLAKLRIANGLKKKLVLATLRTAEEFNKDFMQRVNKMNNYDKKSTDVVPDTSTIRSSHETVHDEYYEKISEQLNEIVPEVNIDSKKNYNTSNSSDVIYLSLQYMSTHSNNPVFPKLISHQPKP